MPGRVAARHCHPRTSILVELVIRVTVLCIICVLVGVAVIDAFHISVMADAEALAVHPERAEQLVDDVV